MSTAATDGTGLAAADGSDSARIDGIDTKEDATALAPTEGSETSPQNGQQHANGDDLAPETGEKESDDGPQGGLGGSDTESGVPTKKKQPRKTHPAKKSTVVSALDALSQLPARFLGKSEELVSQDKALYGQVAWARVRGYPYWPGYICDPQMLVNDYVSMQKYLPLMDTHVWVYFYQTNNSAPVLRSDIALWEDTSKPFHDGFPTKKGKPYKNAKFEEAKEIARKEFQLPIDKRVSWVVVKVLDKETTGEKMARKRKEGAAAKRPAVDQPQEAEPAKKRRGRPPKNVDAPVAAPKDDDVVEATQLDVAPAPKKRGRPPKVKPQPAEVPANEQEEPQPASSPADAAPSTPVKARGRPERKPKGRVAVEELPSAAEQDVHTTAEHADDAEADQTEELNEPRAQEPKRQRGRPPKDATPKRRGRPPKEQAIDALQLDAEVPAEVANDDGSVEPTDPAPAADDGSDDQRGDETASHKPGSDDVPEADAGAMKPQRKRPAASEKGSKARAKKGKASQEEQVDAAQVESAPDDTAKSAEDNVLHGPTETTEIALVIETLDLEQATSLAKDLQGCVKGESKESIALALKIMNALIECTQFTLETLQKSGLPVVVNLLRNSSINPNVKKTASALRKHMIRQSGYEKPKPPPESVEPPAASVEVQAPEPAPPIEPSAAVADDQPKQPVGDQEADHHTTPEGDDGAPPVPFGRDRAIVVEMIQAVITSPKVSREIEKGLFDRFLATTEDYKSQARRVIFGLRDHDLCRQKVLSGSLHILELVFATDEAFTQYNLAPWKAK